jgi:hypothetical protein
MGSLSLALPLALSCFFCSSSSSEFNLKSAPLQQIKSQGKLPQQKTSCLISFSPSNYPDYFLFHAHIPKTGGTTFYRCITEHWDRSHKYGIIQGVTSSPLPASMMKRSTLCRNVTFDHLTSNMMYLSCEIYSVNDVSYVLNKLTSHPQLQPLTSLNILPFTLIRHPMDFLFSALTHHQGTGRKKIACQTFHDLILADQNPNNTLLQCYHYDLRNLQTRALSHFDSFSSSTFSDPLTPWNILGGGRSLRKANLNSALKTLTQDLFFVGITSLYRASMCLFAWQLGQFHLHVPVCDCEYMDPTVGEVLERKKQMNPIQLLSPTALATLRSEYINLDEVLYDYALDLFLTRIEKVEKQENVKLLCSHTDGEAIMLRKMLLESN